MIYRLSNGAMTVHINDLGAEIISVQKNGAERVWQNESGAWDRHCPVLFPVCGRSSVVVEGKDYKMPRHGFARDSRFDVRDVHEDSATFALRSRAETLAVYPFRFELIISYTLKDDAVFIKSTVRNTDDRPLRFALGRHDSFLLENEIDHYCLCFAKQERFLSRRTDPEGKLTDQYEDFGAGCALKLPAEFLKNGESIILDQVMSDRAVLKNDRGGIVASLYWGSIGHIVLWRPKNANMICIEPWSALPDHAEHEPELLKNEKYFRLTGGEEMTINTMIRYGDSK